MGKFKVGDKVRILDAKNIAGAGFDGYENGDILVLIEHLSQLALPGKLTPTPLVLKHSELKYIELVEPFKDQYIESLEKRVETLERLVEDYFKLPVEPSTVDDKPTSVKTPNQLRAEIIEKAKGFVEESKNSKGHYEVKDNYDIFGLPFLCNVDFIVNGEKRTIIALLRGVHSKNVYARGIAKCNPSDVFNEHIGKAIALGRALGLDVSEFEGAVQPTEVVVGMKVSNTYNDEIDEITNIESEKYFVNGSTMFWTEDSLKVLKSMKIINDTHAIYKEDK